MKLYKKICFGNKLLIYYPYPPAPFPPERGVNTGTGVPATCLGATPQTPFLTTIEVFQQPDSLRFLRRLFFYSPNDILHFYRKNFNTKSKFSVGGILNCLNRYNTAIFVLLSLIIKITETRAEIASAIGNTHHISISGAPPRTSIENPHATGSISTS